MYVFLSPIWLGEIEIERKIFRSGEVLQLRETSILVLREAQGGLYVLKLLESVTYNNIHSHRSRKVALGKVSYTIEKGQLHGADLPRARPTV